MKKILRNALSAAALAVVGLLTLAACSDSWDDHYNEPSTTGYDGSAWAYLQSQSDLSDFIEVLQATGYDEILSSSQVLTVFAPANGTFNKDSLLALVAAGQKQAVIDRFVKNHITRYGVSINNSKQDVTLLNSKVVDLGTLSSPTVGDANVTKVNVACDNGIVQVLDAALPFKANIFEQIQIDYEKELAEKGDSAMATSLYAFLSKYDDDELDESRSVARGRDENGDVVYVDSVMIRNNDVLSAIRALIYEEDSSYWAVMPSTEAYQARVEEILPLFKFNYAYNSDETVRDSMQNYYANYMATCDLFYNMNDNQHYTDSIYSTVYSRSNWKYHCFYDPMAEAGILSAYDKTVECSNGMMYYMSDYPFSIYETFFKTIEVEGEYTMYIESAEDWTNSNTTGWSRVTATSADSISNGAYAYIYPTTGTRNTQIAYTIPQNLSGTYDIYVRLLPPSVYYTDSTATILPSQFRASIYERGDDGVMPTKATASFRNPADGSRNYTNDPTKVDSVYIGQYTFANCYYGTSSGVLLQLESYVTSSQKSKFTKEMFLDSIILVPVKGDATEEDEETSGSKRRN